MRFSKPRYAAVKDNGLAVRFVDAYADATII
jgi:hypothetical protein